MQSLRSMLKNWKGLSGVFTAVLIVTIALFIQSCRPMKEVNNTQAIRTEIVREVVRDTTVTIEPDRATVKALVECDSVGNVLLKQIAAYEAGKHVKPPQVDILDNVLTATAEVDSISIYLILKDRYVERSDTSASQEIKIVEVNRLTGWQKFRLWFGNLALILLPIVVYLKFKKIKL